MIVIRRFTEITQNGQVGLRIVRSIDTDRDGLPQPGELENEQEEIEDDDPVRNFVSMRGTS